MGILCKCLFEDPAAHNILPFSYIGTLQYIIIFACPIYIETTKQTVGIIKKQ